jgi:hypothetical protein
VGAKGECLGKASERENAKGNVYKIEEIDNE